MNQSEPVEIRQLANGYIVMPAIPYGSGSAHGGDQDRYVFQTFDGLMAWLKSHFTHRDVSVKLDSLNEFIPEGDRDLESSWFALAMGAAASLEDASMGLHDPVAKRVAQNACKYYRDAANVLWAKGSKV